MGGSSISGGVRVLLALLLALKWTTVLAQYVYPIPRGPGYRLLGGTMMLRPQPSDSDSVVST